MRIRTATLRNDFFIVVYIYLFIFRLYPKHSEKRVLLHTVEKLSTFLETATFHRSVFITIAENCEEKIFNSIKLLFFHFTYFQYYQRPTITVLGTIFMERKTTYFFLFIL